VVVPPDGLNGVLELLVELSLAFVLRVLLVFLVPFLGDPLVAVAVVVVEVDLLLDNGFPSPTAFVVVLVVVSESVETDTCAVLERVDGIVDDRDTVERDK